MEPFKHCVCDVKLDITTIIILSCLLYLVLPCPVSCFALSCILFCTCPVFSLVLVLYLVLFLSLVFCFSFTAFILAIPIIQYFTYLILPHAHHLYIYCGLLPFCCSFVLCFMLSSKLIKALCFGGKLYLNYMTIWKRFLWNHFVWNHFVWNNLKIWIQV